MADFDTSSLLYLVPLTLHALAALAFFTRSVLVRSRGGMQPSLLCRIIHPISHPLNHHHSKPQPASSSSLWGPAVRLRVASLACMALAIPTLVARVVTLQQYCRLEGRVAEKEQEEEESSLFKVMRAVRWLFYGWMLALAHPPPSPLYVSTPNPNLKNTQACSSGHVGVNAAAMAVAYTLLGVLLLQALKHFEALMRWQHQHQQHLRSLHARQQQARARRNLSYDGHTPPGCRVGGGDEGDCGADLEDAAAAGCPYPYSYDYDYGYGYPPSPPFPFPFQQPRRGGGGGGEGRGVNGKQGPAAGIGGATTTSSSTSFGSSSLASGLDSPQRYLHNR